MAAKTKKEQATARAQEKAQATPAADVSVKDISVKTDREAKAVKLSVQIDWSGFTSDQFKEWAGKGIIIKLQDTLRKNPALLTSLAGSTYTVKAVDVASESGEKISPTFHVKARLLKELADSGILSAGVYQRELDTLKKAYGMN